MLRVTLELLPGGDVRKKRLISVIDIWNERLYKLDKIDTLGDYAFNISKYDINEAPKLNGWKQDEIMFSGDVSGYERKKSRSWNLVYRILREFLIS